MYRLCVLILCEIVFIQSIHASCIHREFSSCFCGVNNYLGKQQYILNCTNTGFKNVSILSELPERTEVLIFTGNYIEELPWNLFGTNKSYSQLKVIDMSNNNIRIIHGKSFHHVSTVERLILNHNQISVASGGTNTHHPRMFSNFESLIELHLTAAFHDEEGGLATDLYDIFVNSELKYLRKIHLEQNGIKRFKDPRIFCELPSVMDLYLANNKLTAIDFEISCLPHLRFIDLEYNKIEAVSASDMERLDSGARLGRNITLDLTGNPLRCGPELDAFYSWLECSKLELRKQSSLRCVDGHSEGTCSVLVGGRGCAALHAPSPTVSHPTSHLPLLLTLALFASLALNSYFVYWRQFPHNPIGTWLSSKALASSVHYTKQSNLDDI